MLGLLVDQKMNDGIEVPFFGRPAMTAPALASFALRFRCPVIPARILRLGPGRFRIIWEPDLALPDSGDRPRDVAAFMAEVNATVERWVRAEPQSWLWLHRRWIESGKG
jgi:KDO2-lipid IV(A) lauroyltransferase